MRKFLLFLFLIVACNATEKKLDGAYEIISGLKDLSALGKDSVRTITLFKNGYWISTSFTKKMIIKCSGGSYNIKNNHCIQTVNFNSVDTSTIGKEYRHEYNSDDKYLIASFAAIGTNKKTDSEIVYKKISISEPLQNASLEGVWFPKPGQAGYGYTDNKEVIRIFAFPAFVRTIYSFKEKRFLDTYGGTYQFDGKELIEKIEYSNYQLPPGSAIEWSVKKLTDTEMQLFDVDSFNDEEIFDKKNNK